jgi:hypothetical protein
VKIRWSSLPPSAKFFVALLSPLLLLAINWWCYLRSEMSLKEFLQFGVLFVTLWVVAWYTIETHLNRLVSNAILLAQDRHFALANRPWIYLQDIIKFKTPDSFDFRLRNGGRTPAYCKVTLVGLEVTQGGQTLASTTGPTEISRMIVPPDSHMGDIEVETSIKFGQNIVILLPLAPQIIVRIRLDYRSIDSPDSPLPYAFQCRMRVKRFDINTVNQSALVEDWHLIGAE